jgi:hypothetical protein
MFGLIIVFLKIYNIITKKNSYEPHFGVQRLAFPFVISNVPG